MSANLRETRFGLAVWDSELKKYFPIVAYSLSKLGFSNCLSFELFAPCFVLEARSHYEQLFGRSVIVYPI